MSLQLFRKSALQNGAIQQLALRGMTKSKRKPGSKKAGGGSNYDESKNMYEEMLKYLQPPPRPKVKLTQEMLDERAKMAKDWSRHTLRNHKELMKEKHTEYRLRQEALMEIRKIDEGLFQHAYTPDLSPFPLDRHPPVETPPHDLK